MINITFKIARVFLFLFLAETLIAQQNDLWVGASSSPILPKKRSKTFLAGTKVNRLATGVPTSTSSVRSAYYVVVPEGFLKARPANSLI